MKITGIVTHVWLSGHGLFQFGIIYRCQEIPRRIYSQRRGNKVNIVKGQYQPLFGIKTKYFFQRLIAPVQIALFVKGSTLGKIKAFRNDFIVSSRFERRMSVPAFYHKLCVLRRLSVKTGIRITDCRCKHILHLRLIMNI